MIPTFQQVRLTLDVEARAGFDPAPANQTEAGVKAGEMDHHLTWAASLLRDGYLEDAYARYEKAEIAACTCVIHTLAIDMSCGNVPFRVAFRHDARHVALTAESPRVIATPGRPRGGLGPGE